MQIKNIVRIALVTGILAHTPTHSMFVKGLKTCIRIAGSTLGLGLPIIPVINLGIVTLKKEHIDNVSIVKDARKPSLIEEKFLREVIKDNSIALTISQNPGSSRVIRTNDKTILVDPTMYIEQKSFASNLSLEEALQKNTPEAFLARQTFSALAEHQISKSKDNYYKKIKYVDYLLPLLSTGIAGYGFKTLFPLNKQASLPKYWGRFAAKVAGGSFLMCVNIAMTVLMRQHIKNNQTYSSDENISPQNCNGMIRHLGGALKISGHGLDPVKNLAILKRIKHLEERAKNS